MNILKNSNLEQASSSNPRIPANWYPSTAIGITNPVWATDSSHSPTHSYKFNLAAANAGNVPKDGGSISYATRPAVFPNKVYRVSLWRRLDKVNVFTGTPSVTPQEPFLRMGQQRADGSWNHYDDFKLGEGTIDWGYLEFRFNTRADTATVSVEVIQKYSSGMMWVDDITLEEVTTGSVSFSSVPAGARIFMDNTDLNKTTPATVAGVQQGSHTYSLKLAGYQDVTGTVQVEAGKTATVTASLVLIVTTGTLNISSIPPGAQVYLDGTAQGAVTPVILKNVPSGTHTYSLKLAGYADSEGTVTLEAGKTAVISATLTPIVITGTLDLKSIPPGADVYIDGTKLTGVTPQVIQDLSEGAHSLILKMKGYKEYTQSFNILAGQTTTISVTLVKTASPALFVIGTVAGLGIIGGLALLRK